MFAVTAALKGKDKLDPVSVTLSQLHDITGAALISVSRSWTGSEFTPSVIGDRPHLFHYLQLPSWFLHRYQIILLGNRDTCVNNLPIVVTWQRCYSWFSFNLPVFKGPHTLGWDSQNYSERSNWGLLERDFLQAMLLSLLLTLSQMLVFFPCLCAVVQIQYQLFFYLSVCCILSSMKIVLLLMQHQLSHWFGLQWVKTMFSGH